MAPMLGTTQAPSACSMGNVPASQNYPSAPHFCRMLSELQDLIDQGKTNLKGK